MSKKTVTISSFGVAHSSTQLEDKKRPNAVVSFKKNQPTKTNYATRQHLTIIPTPGLTSEELMKLLKQPHKNKIHNSQDLHLQLRNELVLRLLVDTFSRLNELKMAKVEDLDISKNLLWIRHPKKTYNPKTNVVVELHRRVYYSDYTKTLLLRYLNGRKRGFIIQSRQSNMDKPISPRTIENIVDRYATDAGIQKILYIDRAGRPRRKVTVQTLRESSERLIDNAALHHQTISSQTAKIAGHGSSVKERNYSKYTDDDNLKTLKKYHPAFQ